MQRVDRLRALLSQVDPIGVNGTLRATVGFSLRARVPEVRVGELVTVHRRDGQPLQAAVVGFADDDVMLSPLGPVSGIGPGDRVTPWRTPMALACSPQLLGRVLDGLGQPLDDGPPLTSGQPWPIERPPPNPWRRPRIDRPLTTGIRAIDALTPLGVGQRLGIFAGSGVGKTTLLGQIARQTDADVFVACCIGERGRELRDFLDDALGSDGLRRGVVVCATSDVAAAIRLQSAWVATAIAEWFRDQGHHVLLLMDSLTRFARAAREVGLASGEMPVRRGYPPSVFGLLPALIERTGTAERGSITAIYTLLMEGEDLDDPIIDEARSLLDGHIVLRRDLAARGHWPAIDPLHSLSRLSPALTDDAQRAAAQCLRSHLAVYEAKRDFIALGAYQSGTDAALDAALARLPAIEAFLRQGTQDFCDAATTQRQLLRLAEK